MTIIESARRTRVFRAEQRRQALRGAARRHLPVSDHVDQLHAAGWL